MKRKPKRKSKSADTELAPLHTPLEAAIEEERSRLGQARAVLRCLRLAVLYSDQEGDDPDVGDFSDAAELAQELVRQSIENLDSVYIGPLMKGKARKRDDRRAGPSFG